MEGIFALHDPAIRKLLDLKVVLPFLHFVSFLHLNSSASRSLSNVTATSCSRVVYDETSSNGAEMQVESSTSTYDL